MAVPDTSIGLDGEFQGIALTVDPRDAPGLEAFSAAHLGKAIVFVVGGKIIWNATLLKPLPIGEIDIPSSESEAQEIFKTLYRSAREP